MPVGSDPDTGTLTVALNPPDGQRGYLGIELTRAPVAPGLYYLAVRSVGATPYRCMEREPGPDPEAGWYLRGIRMTMDGAGAPMTWSDGTARAPEGRLTVKATSPTLADLATARVAVARPARLGDRTDGYPVCHTPGVLLEPLVIDLADTYGIPPHYLMSQVHKEAMKGSNGCLNEYSYRYEPIGFDFTSIVGDGQGVAYGGVRYFYMTDQAFLRSGLVGVTGLPEVVPREAIGEPKPARVPSAELTPVGATPTATFAIAGFQGPAYWDVEVYDQANPTITFSRVSPGEPPSGPTEFTVDCRAGRITFGAPGSDWQTLRASYGPLLLLRPSQTPGGFGAALDGPHFVDTATIIQRGPNQVTPPAQPTTTMAAWAAARICPSQVLTQSITRYGRSFAPAQACNLLQEDPSFELQGQWYGGASFGLLQVWPANAATTINHAASPEKKTYLRNLYNPLTEPGTKLFIPAIGVEFGAAADVYLDVRGEVKSDANKVWPYEGACASDDTAWPRTQCTWQRWWARRFAAFNRGSDDRDCLPNGDQCDWSEFSNYGAAIVQRSSDFLPMVPTAH